jgi:hypothetical protein
MGAAPSVGGERALSSVLARSACNLFGLDTLTKITAAPASACSLAALCT